MQEEAVHLCKHTTHPVVQSSIGELISEEINDRGSVINLHACDSKFLASRKNLLLSHCYLLSGNPYILLSQVELESPVIGPALIACHRRVLPRASAQRASKCIEHLSPQRRC